ncbi:MAG: A/G-specific adenine glycosylase [Phycisphaerae bacterium]
MAKRLRAGTVSPGGALRDAGWVRGALLRWYRRARRDLPWRRTRDPYRIWLSEIMLQQTRVETVVPYYERFLAAFPSVGRLAAAPLDHVLKRWEGLGYYSRARNLHRAAQVVAREHAGEFPRTSAALRSLPGVGRYTAAAVASIAFDEPVAVLDGNVKRVLARLFAIDTPIESAATIARLWQLAESLVAPRTPGDFNQALMELGATVCMPRGPRCDSCPIRSACRALATGRVAELPRKRARRAVPIVNAVAAAIERRGRYLVVQRPADGLLGGLWELPGGVVPPRHAARATLEEHVRRRVGVRIAVGAAIGEFTHTFTHLKLRVQVYRATVTRGRAPRDAGTPPAKTCWLAARHFDELACATIDRRILEHVAAQDGARPAPPRRLDRARGAASA